MPWQVQLLTNLLLNTTAEKARRSGQPRHRCRCAHEYLRTFKPVSTHLINLITGGGCRAASCLGPVSPLQPWPRAPPPRATRRGGGRISRACAAEYTAPTLPEPPALCPARAPWCTCPSSVVRIPVRIRVLFVYFAWVFRVCMSLFN